MDNPVEGVYAIHTQDCHHHMNTLRRKGPDCFGPEPMTWSCCDAKGGRSERVAVHGCRKEPPTHITFSDLVYVKTNL